MIFTPNASWVSTNSRSKRSIKTSRFPGWSAYCLNSTTGQQNCEDCICLSPIGSVMTDLTTLCVKIKKRELMFSCSFSVITDQRSPFTSHFSQVTVFRRDVEGGLRPNRYHVGSGGRPGH